MDVKKFLPVFCLCSLAAVACALPAASARADVKGGIDAWSAGDYDAAVKQWKPLADRGDPDAQFNLAQAYTLGRGVPRDPEKAKKLYGEAASHGHLQAADIYGLLLFQGGEREKAMPYIKASAARGDPNAQYILGVAHFNGDLAEKDWIRAYALETLASQAGMPQAARALAKMDEHIPLADRQKSVILSTQLAADAEATRTRLATAAELGAPTTPPHTRGPQVADTPPKAPEVVSAERAVAEAMRVAGNDSPATAGADYTRAASPSVAMGSPASTPKPTPVHPEPRASAPAAPASGPWRVQLGAFGVARNAEALWTKLRNRPELTGRTKLLVPAGRLTKLQAGGFASQAAASAACSRLSASGYTCLAVRD
ncbi:SPOR domain-containing protein [Novosphingobium mangrovi (ex Huang et al. 2023)]|nr:SPOR domain-containing protein [Novosphingobium mangrovi (ex Huang et al. 2023)]